MGAVVLSKLAGHDGDRRRHGCDFRLPAGDGLALRIVVDVEAGTQLVLGVCGPVNGLFGFQRGVTVASRSQLGRPA